MLRHAHVRRAIALSRAVVDGSNTRARAIIIVDCRYITTTTTICNDAASEHLFFEHGSLVFPRIARREQVSGRGGGIRSRALRLHRCCGHVVESGKRRPRASDRNSRFLRAMEERGGKPTWPRKRAREKRQRHESVFGRADQRHVGGMTQCPCRWLDKSNRGEEQGTGMRRRPRLRLAPFPYHGRYWSFLKCTPQFVRQQSTVERITYLLTIKPNGWRRTWGGRPKILAHWQPPFKSSRPPLSPFHN